MSYKYRAIIVKYTLSKYGQMLEKRFKIKNKFIILN